MMAGEREMFETADPAARRRRGDAEMAIVFAFFVAGFAGLALQVAWVRLLVYFLEGFTIAFGVAYWFAHEVYGAQPTPAEQRKASETQRMRKAREAIERDPAVKGFQDAFDAVVEADTIEPIEAAEGT